MLDLELRVWDLVGFSRAYGDFTTLDKKHVICLESP